MGYAIIGFGAIGQALARAFARKHIEVAVASRQPPEALLPQAQAIGSTGLSSAVVAKAFPGARLVKGFNHLLARTLAADPHVKGDRRVVFLSSDDKGAAAQVAALAEELGFAPVNLGKLQEGGALVQAREDKTWGPLIFQDLFKKEP